MKIKMSCRRQIPPEAEKNVMPKADPDFIGTKRKIISAVRVFTFRFSLYTIFVGVLIVLYSIFYGWLAFLRYKTFAIHGIDLAIYNQLFFNTLHGKFMYTSILASIVGENNFGNHTTLIPILFLPIYAIWQHPLTLLFLQTFLLAIGAIPVYLLAKEQINQKFGLLFAFLYLIYPALGAINSFEFHTIALTTTFLLFSVYFLSKDNIKWFLLFLTLTLLCEENMALVVLFFGFYTIVLRKGWKLSLSLILTGIIWFILSIEIIIPYFYKDEYIYTTIYSHLGENFAQIAKYIILHPGVILKYIFTLQKIEYLFRLFAPLGLVSILGISALIPSIPIFMQNLLAQPPYQTYLTSIYYYYTAPIIPFIFASGILGVSNLLKLNFLKQRQWILMESLLGIGVFTSAFWGLPIRELKSLNKYQIDVADEIKNEFINKLPDKSAVVTTFEFQPKLSNREKLYSFHFVYYGIAGGTGKKYVLPEDAQYALIDFMDPPWQIYYTKEGAKNTRKFLRDGNWGIVDFKENIVLFKKDYSSKLKIYEMLSSAGVYPRQKIIATFSDEIVLLDYKIKQNPAKSSEIEIDWYWRVTKKIEKDYMVALYFLRKDNYELITQRFHPIGYGIYLINELDEDEILKETTKFYLGELKKGSYIMGLGLVDRHHETLSDILELSSKTLDYKLNYKTLDIFNLDNKTLVKVSTCPPFVGREDNLQTLNDKIILIGEITIN